jgi:large subunit ribosomal protein L11
MAKEKIDALVEGGKASAAPPLGPALGPLKVNIGQVVAEINKKTAAFKGMKVPVTVVVDTETKEFEIEIGTPPMSQLIKKELNLKTASGIPNKDKVANMSIEQVIKVAKMKQDSLLVNNLKSAVKTVIGSCNAAGILVEGKIAVEINPEVDAGKYDKEIDAGKDEHPAEKDAILAEQLKKVRAKFAGELEKIAAAKKAKVAKEEKKAGKAVA